MNNDDRRKPSVKGEILFRVCAYALTGMQCTLYVLILITFICVLFYVVALFSKNATIYSSETGLTSHGIVHTALLLCFLVIPNFLGWFITFLYPLKSKSQTWGMKVLGLEASHPTEKNLSWKTVFLQEGLQTITCSFIVGLLGLIWALLRDDEKTFFNRISEISIIQKQAKLRFVEEFREYRKKKV